MGLSHEISLRCRHCLIVYSGETVAVIPRRWRFRTYDRRFRVDGQWPTSPVRAVRQRYWRRLRVLVLPVDAMLPIVLSPGSGRFPRRTPPTLTFAHAKRRDQRITVRVTVGLLVKDGDVIERINHTIAARTGRTGRSGR
ncbi:hypothetical protein [Streptacidiphilus rugosus]|uniref:hypothetical protein n=1 Tax=Streptacidiphilus rugosus TaxID=405783 RepID=UPI00055B19C7|nr:hypothetical protein [Streptacidiphilus rugosus]